MAKKKSTVSLWAMLVLIVMILIALFLFPSCGGQSPKGATPTTTTESAANQADSTTLIKAGTAAPDFTVAMLDGTTVTLSSLRGKVVLINFWATWCPPCREEFTRVQKDLIDRFAGREFVFLPISRGEETRVVEAFLKKSGYTFAVGLDPTREIYDLYASNFIPRNFLVDQSGKVIAATVGYEATEFNALIQQIETTLAQ